MSGWKRNLLIVLGALVLAGGGAYYWLIMESHLPSDAKFELDISEVRKLADTLPGDKPVKIDAEHVGTIFFPSTAVVAGDGWSMTPLPVYSYRVDYADGTSGIIDTTMPDTEGMMQGFDKDAFARVEAALGKARFIVITHEHGDHLGGLAVYPDFKTIAPSVNLTKEQIDHPEFSQGAALGDEKTKLLTPLVYDKYKAIAPGVVLIKAAGHSPGSQMVYVRKADGSEVLFLGDVAWHTRNIDTLRERARLVTMFFLREDRTAVFGQLKALSDLRTAEPKITIVPGHDGEVINTLLTDGVLSKGF